MNRPTLVVRLVVALLIIAACLLGIRSAWRVGASAVLAKAAAKTVSLEQADLAVATDPNNPDTHSARGQVLLNLNRFEEAASEYGQAASLRPRDFFVWLEYGRALDTAGDAKGALEVLKESVRLAPYYSDPRWQYGNVLFRSGRVEEGFREMRRAAQSDPTLLPVLTDLVWTVYRGDIGVVRRTLDPQTAGSKIQLARFFIKKGRVTEGVELFREAGTVAEEERRAILSDLIAAKRYREAYSVWSSKGTSGGLADGIGLITDPGFEGDIKLKEPGFGWRGTTDTTAAAISLDQSEPKQGARSLHIEWSGNSNPGTQVITQTVLVEKDTSYRLSFAYRAKDVVSGGLPVLVISDASGKEGKVLAKSSTLPARTEGWLMVEVDFKTDEDTDAIILSLQRENCSSSPCPIFGTTWLDDFSLQRR
jgi:tetratricopeptide (TPR) repeat protein